MGSQAHICWLDIEGFKRRDPNNRGEEGGEKMGAIISYNHLPMSHGPDKKTNAQCTKKSFPGNTRLETSLCAHARQINPPFTCLWLRHSSLAGAQTDGGGHVCTRPPEVDNSMPELYEASSTTCPGSKPVTSHEILSWFTKHGQKWLQCCMGWH